MGGYRDIKTILIPKSIFHSFISHVDSTYIEVGGLLIGHLEGDKALCTDIKIGRNILNSPVEFRLDDEFLAEVIMNLSGDEDIIGVIHSHPAPPYPSIIDRKYMRLWPVIWLIVDSRTLEYKAWVDYNEINVVLR